MMLELEQRPAESPAERAKRKKAESAKRYAIKNREKIRVQRREYRQRTKEHRAAYQREYVAKNPEVKREAQRRYYAKNKLWLERLLEPVTMLQQQAALVFGPDKRGGSGFGEYDESTARQAHDDWLFQIDLELFADRV